MRLYDNDAYREDFMSLVYGLLSDDSTNDRANQIIDAFDSAPEAEAEVLPSNGTLTLEQLRGMEGLPVWVVGISAINDFKGHWDIFEWSDEKMIFCRSLEEPDLDNYNPEGKLGIAGWRAYRRRPEEDTNA